MTTAATGVAYLTDCQSGREVPEERVIVVDVIQRDRQWVWRL